MRTITDICICVATYKRPHLLKKLLKSLESLKTSNKFTYHLIVVDNDKGGSAAEVVHNFHKTGLNFTYLIEPKQNISLARNKAINFSKEKLIAFIDDDETADSEWLLNLFNTLTLFNADAVIGKVVSIFPKDTTEIIRNSRPFCLPNPPTGSTSNFVLATNNCLIKKSILFDNSDHFDPDFGLTGGGDSDFFNTLKKKGAMICYCREAIVYETIPKNRAKPTWLMKRFFRNGQVTYSIMKKELRESSTHVLRERRSHYLNKLIQKSKTLIRLKMNYSSKNSTLEEIAKTQQEMAFCLGFIYRSLGFKYEFYKNS